MEGPLRNNNKSSIDVTEDDWKDVSKYTVPRQLTQGTHGTQVTIDTIDDHIDIAQLEPEPAAMIATISAMSDPTQDGYDNDILSLIQEKIQWQRGIVLKIVQLIYNNY